MLRVFQIISSMHFRIWLMVILNDFYYLLKAYWCQFTFNKYLLALKNRIQTLNRYGKKYGASSNKVTGIRKIATHWTNIKRLRNDRIGRAARSGHAYFWLPWITCQLKETLFLSLYWKSSSYWLHNLILARLRVQVPHCSWTHFCRKVFSHFQSL